MGKLAVIFPGIGYTADKPLLHYSRRIAAECGYEILVLPYTGFPKKVKGDRGKMVESYKIALKQSKEMLSDIDLECYEQVLFIGKSIGTIVAAQIASENSAPVRLVYFTPLEETFSFPVKEAIAFTGSADPWVGMEKSRIRELCEKQGIPCFVIPEANHSLESEDIQSDIQNLKMIMSETKKFIICMQNDR